jgi:hypothetical protein
MYGNFTRWLLNPAETKPASPLPDVLPQH